MKNFIKIISAAATFALVFGLFADVAAAQLGSSNSNGSSGSLSSNNSNGSSGGLTSNNTNGTESGGLGSNNTNGTESGGLGSNNTNGTEGGSSSNGGSNNGGNNGSDNGSSRSRSRGSSSSYVRPQISDVTVTSLAGNLVRISFTTSAPAVSRLVYGSVSQAAVSNAVNFGYQFTSATTVSGKTHTFDMSIKPGQVVYVRPVAANGRSIYFGGEFALTKAASRTVKPIAKPIVKPVVKKPTQPVIGEVANEGTETNVIIDITGSDVNQNEVIEAGEGEANVGNTPASTKIGNFFKSIWNFLIGKN